MKISSIVDKSSVVLVTLCICYIYMYIIYICVCILCIFVIDIVERIWPILIWILDSVHGIKSSLSRKFQC